MKKHIIIILATAWLLSCGPNTQSTPEPDSSRIEATEQPRKIKKKDLLLPQGENIHTHHQYTDMAGRDIVIKNGFPKGGMHYTAPNGKDFVYAILWSSVANASADTLELSLEFPADSFELTTDLTNNHFKLYLPSKTMTPDKFPAFNYGLDDLSAILDKGLDQPSTFQKTLLPGDSCMFYVVSLFDRGVDGTVRSALRLKGKGLFYNLNGKEIYCGQLVAKSN